jgi:hypothetical protein
MDGKAKYSEQSGSKDFLNLICPYFLPECNSHFISPFPNILTLPRFKGHINYINDSVLNSGDKT